MTNEWVISAGGGLSDPTGLFEEQMKGAGSLILSAGRHVNPSWFIGLRAGYFPFDSEAPWRSETGQSELRFWTLEIDSRLLLYPESWFTPYVVMGAGAALETQTYPEQNGSRTVDAARPGITGGVGISMHREQSPVSFFTELVYHHLPMEDGSRQWLRWTTGLRLSVGGRPF